MYIKRAIEDPFKKAISKQKSILLLGPRQTGKTTLLQRLPHDRFLNLANPDLRQRYEKRPAILIQEIYDMEAQAGKRPLAIIDEIQKVPSLMDAIQVLIDEKKAVFILTGSSARKLRRGSHVNLLPGRILSFRLDPFYRQEYAEASLQDQLLYGSLPFVALEPSEDAREQALRSYVTTYLEEEVRAEALVRNLSPFGRFLELAAAESGSLINLRKLSQEIGVSHVTIGSYFQILEDCLIVERIDSLTRSATRKKLTRGSKYLFFDLGVRRLAAQEGRRLPLESWGKLLEQWVGLELLRALRQSSGRLRFWRDPDGPEVDWVIEQDNRMIPIEVKWTESPALQDTRHLQTFLSEYPEAKEGFIVCRTAHALLLAPHIRAIPWQDLLSIM
jgi:uncharacterized protein